MKDKSLFLKVWDYYNLEKINNIKVNDQTKEFFEGTISNLDKETFFSRRIIHFGCSIGSYFSQLPINKDREIIGYDYSPTAIKKFHDPEKNMSGRLIDLDEIENSKLSYHSYIENDLSVPADVIMIRVLENLNTEAMILLLFTLILQAKNGTTFYIEMSETQNEKERETFEKFGGKCSNPAGYAASFFAPRTDMKFISHINGEQMENAKSLMRIEKLIVQKTSM